MNELERLCRLHETDKRCNDEGENIYHGYSSIYFPLFLEFKNEPLNFLEIGIATGASHKVWRDFFPNATIIGIDTYYQLINKHREEGMLDSDIIPILREHIKGLEDYGIKVIVGDQTDKNLIDKHFENNSLDVIIDDGGHHSRFHQMSVKYLWPKLKSGGIYIIEDLATCLLREFRDFDDPRSSTINWINSIIDGNPFSYYFTDEESIELMNSIKLINSIGELAIFVKK